MSKKYCYLGAILLAAQGVVQAQTLTHVAPVGGGLPKDYSNTLVSAGAMPSVNDHGQVAGTTTQGSFVFTVGSSTVPTLLEGSSSMPSYATGINNNGLISIVEGSTAGGFYRTVLVDAATGRQANSTVLPLPTGYLGATPATIAWGINNSGETAGRTIVPGATLGTGITTVFGASSTGTVTTINTGAFGGIANGINDAGDNVGRILLNSSGNNSHAYVYSKATGTVTDIGSTLQSTLSPFSSTLNSAAFAINANNEVTGFYTSHINSSFYNHAFLYNATTGSMLDINPTGVLSAVGYSIDNAGDIVGLANVSKTLGSSPAAFLYTKQGGFIDLNKFASDHGLLAAGDMLTEATSISNNGEFITGFAVHNGKQEIFVLSMVPEPSTGTLFATAALAIMGAVRRRKKSAT